MDIVSVTDRRRCVRPLEEQVELVCEAGADMVVLREKDLSEGEYRALAASVARICRSFRTEFCVNLHAPVAEEMGSALWLPFDAFVRAGRPRVRRLGVSVHSFEEGVEAAGGGADFVVYGNVFETSCKPGKAARGLDDVRRLSEALDAPVYAIGGITPGNIGEVAASGAQGACLMSGLMASESPSKVVSACRSASQTLERKR